MKIGIKLGNTSIIFIKKYAKNISNEMHELRSHAKVYSMEFFSSQKISEALKGVLG